MKLFKKTILILAAAAIPCSVLAEPYKVRLPMSEDDEGAMVYLMNFDTDEKIDSTLVTDKTALFEG